MIYLFVYLCINACIALMVQWWLKNDERASTFIEEFYKQMSEKEKEFINRNFNRETMELGKVFIITIFLFGLPIYLFSLFSKEENK